MSAPPRITRWARAAAAASFVGGGLIPVATVASVFTSAQEVLFASLGFDSLAHLVTWQAPLARAVVALPALAGGLAFLVLARGFVRIAHGDGFDPAVVRALGQFSALIVFGTCLAMAAPIAASLILSVGAPPDGGRLSLQLGSGHLFGLIAALGVWTFARLLAEARRLEIENQEFV